MADSPIDPVVADPNLSAVEHALSGGDTPPASEVTPETTPGVVKRDEPVKGAGARRKRGGFPAGVPRSQYVGQSESARRRRERKAAAAKEYTPAMASAPSERGADPLPLSGDVRNGPAPDAAGAVREVDPARIAALTPVAAAAIEGATTLAARLVGRPSVKALPEEIAMMAPAAAHCMEYYFPSSGAPSPLVLLLFAALPYAGRVVGGIAAPSETQPAAT